VSWPLVHIGEHVEKVETWNPISSGIDDLFKYIDLSSVDKDSKSIIESAVDLIHPNSAPSRARQIVKQNDVLISTVRPNLNGVALVNQELNGATASTGYCVLRTNKKSLDSKYLFYWVQSSDFIDDMIKNATGANYPAVSDRIVKNNLIPLPPLEEQKRIAAILDKADAIRRKRQQAIKLADDFLRSVFLEMFGDPVTNPKGWEVVNVEDVCSDIVDCINKTAKSVDYETPYKMIRTTNVRNMKIDLSDVRYVDKDVYEKWISRLRPETGDIVFTREAPAGEAGIIDFDDLVFLGQRTMQFRPDKSQITSSFLLHEMMGSGIKEQMDKMSSGSTVKHLSVPECKKFKVRKPPVDLQIKFENIRFKTLSLLKLENRAGDFSLFESLSQKAFSGKI
jgi:type I restriction enzyme S subunit